MRFRIIADQHRGNALYHRAVTAQKDEIKAVFLARLHLAKELKT